MEEPEHRQHERGNVEKGGLGAAAAVAASTGWVFCGVLGRLRLVLGDGRLGVVVLLRVRRLRLAALNELVLIFSVAVSMSAGRVAPGALF